MYDFTETSLDDCISPYLIMKEKKFDLGIMTVCKGFFRLSFDITGLHFPSTSQLMF